MSGEPSRSAHLEWLKQLTRIPTAAGREGRVIRWIEQWVSERPDLTLTADDAGNLVMTGGLKPVTGSRPLYITAHLDHPAFVVERIVAPQAVELSFRGGVMADFFENAPVTLYTADDRSISATLVECTAPERPIAKMYLAELDGDADDLVVGDVGTWTLPEQHIDEMNRFHTNACDDLAALAAAISAYDVLLEKARNGAETEDVRLLFTRAEEIGFVGAIAACRNGCLPEGARLVALENSRSFPDSPIGGGPILRVGDRISVFTPRLTSAIAKRAEEVTGGPAQPLASQKNDVLPTSPWQRKLMAGGACEASVFCAHGFDSTCLCLPLGNYHNMPHLDALQNGTYDRERLGPPRCEPEFISIDDYHGLVDLLAAIGERLPDHDPVMERLDRLWDERAHVVAEKAQ